PETVRPGAGGRRLVPDPGRAAAGLCVPGPPSVAAFADGGPAGPPGPTSSPAPTLLGAPASARGPGGPPGWLPRHPASAPAAAVLAVLLIVWRFPAVAADLAAAGLIALGLYGIALALFWPSAPFVTYDDTLRFGAVLVGNPTWAAGAGLEGGLMLALGLWLVPRTVMPHARVLLRPEPGADLAGRVEQL